MPSSPSSSSAIDAGSSRSESTHLMSIFPPWCAPPWWSASITDRYASFSCVYLPTIPIRTGVSAAS